jgi:hypothetical protein
MLLLRSHIIFLVCAFKLASFELETCLCLLFGWYSRVSVTLQTQLFMYDIRYLEVIKVKVPFCFGDGRWGNEHRKANAFTIT